MNGANDDDRSPTTIGIVDLGLHRASDEHPAPVGAEGPGVNRTDAHGAGDGDQQENPDRRRRTILLALGVAAILVLAANLAPRGPAPVVEKAPEGTSTVDAASGATPLDVCEAVAFANQTGGLPSKPNVLPSRAGGYFAYTDSGNRATVIAGLTYLDGTIALCRPVTGPGDGSPEPEQPELPALPDGRTYAYEVGAAGLTLIGERAADGTITRNGPTG